MLLSPWNLVICSLNPDKTAPQCLEILKNFQWKVTPWKTTLKKLCFQNVQELDTLLMFWEKDKKTNQHKTKKNPNQPQTQKEYKLIPFIQKEILLTNVYFYSSHMFRGWRF